MGNINPAKTLLVSWLNKCNIPFKSDDKNLLIRWAGPDEQFGQALYDPHKICSTDLAVCMEEFHKLTTNFGWGQPVPLVRKPAAQKRIADDRSLARWRHNEMRTVPNASTEEISAYDDIAWREAKIFVSRNHWLCKTMGYDIDIAHNDALIWINTYLGRYKLIGENTLDDNRRLLTNFLRQRFMEQRGGLFREHKNVGLDPSYSDYLQSYTAESTDPEWKAGHDQIKVRSQQPRREKARSLLAAAFAAMPHDQMLLVLNETSEKHPCFDTRKAAAQYLLKHTEACESCKARKLEVEDGVTSS